MRGTVKRNPIPVRLDIGDESEVKRLNEETGLQQQDIIRRAIRFAVPLFLSGKVDILKYGRPLVVEISKSNKTAV